MADVHLGVGATVGSVIAMEGAVSPAAVGVDIGCGMAAVKTNLTARDLPDSSIASATTSSAWCPSASRATTTPWTPRRPRALGRVPTLTKDVQSLFGVQ